MADIQSVLRVLEQFEQLMQEIYTGVAETFAADADAAAMFSRLAFEERSHLGEVKFLRRLVRQNTTQFSDVEVDLETMQREVTQLDKVRQSVPTLSLHEAVVLAIEFEGGVAEVHSRRAIAKANPDLARVLAGLRAGDERHREMLVDFARKRGMKSM